MKSVVLKGTQNGFEVILNDADSFEEIKNEFTELLDQLVKKSDYSTKKGMHFDIITGNRALSVEQKQALRDIVNKRDNLVINEFKADVMSNDEAYHLRDENRVTIIDQTIRNGQDLKIKGDVLFLGKIHKGGKLITNGNLFCMGNVEGIVQVGFPVDESKLAVGNFHSAQQVRIGEQIEVIADKKEEISENLRTVVYVNGLHSISYSNLDNIKEISPKFFSRIGGM
ncbi:septum site-determining protein MinC [Fructilactobacillus frigidiflavus]|uniref:septum site-determining protein MinC n=1 Tax=Fructilactobacillus frigidiflavus TaxID=3242688 RepID=UPI0037570F93